MEISPRDDEDARVLRVLDDVAAAYRAGSSSEFRSDGTDDEVFRAFRRIRGRRRRHTPVSSETGDRSEETDDRSDDDGSDGDGSAGTNEQEIIVANQRLRFVARTVQEKMQVYAVAARWYGRAATAVFLINLLLLGVTGLVSIIEGSGGEAQRIAEPIVVGIIIGLASITKYFEWESLAKTYATDSERLHRVLEDIRLEAGLGTTLQGRRDLTRRATDMLADIRSTTQHVPWATMLKDLHPADDAVELENL